MKEVTDFDRRYYEKLAGPDHRGRRAADGDRHGHVPRLKDASRA